MFTGIIEELGTMAKVQHQGIYGTLKINCHKITKDIHLGDSIAVNGVCLTVTEFGKDWFTADVMNETLKRTAFSNIRVGDSVNLERAMRSDGRFGGHIVSGHIDGTGRIKAKEKIGNAFLYTISVTKEILKYVVEKGSIAIDGISLTVVEVTPETFKVSVIPHTMVNTALPQKGPGVLVNLECDPIGKYVEKLMKYN